VANTMTLYFACTETGRDEKTRKAVVGRHTGSPANSIDLTRLARAFSSASPSILASI
jgi:hypothetical protein